MNSLRSCGDWRRGRGSHQSIKHDQGCLALPHLVAEYLHDTRQPLFHQFSKRADVMHATRNRAFDIKGKQFHVLNHARVRFCKQRDVRNPAAGGDMVESNLIGKYRLAGSRRPLDDIHATLEQPAANDLVQCLDAGRRLFESHATLPAIVDCSIGSVTTKVDPLLVGSSMIDPPCRRANSSAIHKPSPYPTFDVLGTARLNFSKMRLTLVVWYTRSRVGYTDDGVGVVDRS